MVSFALSAFADEASSNLIGQIKALKRNNIKMVEIRNIDEKCIIDYSDEEIKAIANTLFENEVVVSAIASPIGKIGIDEDFAPHFARFKRACDAAKILNTKYIRMFSFFVPQNIDEAESKIIEEKVLLKLNTLCDYANLNGLLCCHENEKEIFGDTFLHVRSLHKVMGGKMGGIFDPANYIQCGENPKSFFKELAPYINYLHLKDALSADLSVVPCGYGDGCICDILHMIADEKCKSNEKIMLTIEPHLAVFPGLLKLQTEEIKHKFSYSSTDEAFDDAVKAVKIILDREGFDYE